MAVAAKRPRDGSDGDADARKRQKGAEAIDLTEEASPQEKKMRASINDVAADLSCPITQELPIEPVMAKDGKIYERTAILEWFRKKDGEATSPSTGKVIGTELLPAVQVRNTIEALVKSGAIAGELAEAWKQKLADETLVKETRAKADGGDGQAMYSLGVWYKKGSRGLTKDKAQARAWYERSAATRDPRGMGTLGECLLLRGSGGPQNTALGLVMVSQGAAFGSDVGAYYLGRAFFKGKYGLPEDRIQARFWLKKVAKGVCKYKHLSDKAIAEAAKWLRELEE